MERKLSEQEVVRREKIEQLANISKEAFRLAIKASHTTQNIHDEFNQFTREELEAKNVNISVNGRIIAKRGPFLVLQDRDNNIQVYMDKKSFNESQQELLKLLDLGDILHAKGLVSKTHTGELMVKAAEFELLTKALKPLPDKFHGLVDQEERYRHRYVDLIVNKDSKNTFILRSKIIRSIRKFFDDNGYLEVDTPVLQPILGGAAAKPFITYYNALSSDFYLRIATELPLKKCLVGGLERVYEIGRIFRNEGVDTTHNPEFTSIEFYEAYSNMEGMMERCEQLFNYLANELGFETVTFGGKEISFKAPFNRINMVDAVSEKVGVDVRTLNDEQAVELAKKHGIKVEKYFKLGHVINELFELYVEKELIQPTFVWGHPIEISPLAVKTPEDPRFTLRAELFINTKEFANMFTELTDPIDQLERFESQLEEKESGNEEANEIDWDFVESLEYGMPPAGGCGIGIDRLIMLLTENDSIREVLLFPQLKNIEK
ncbi:lysine--tRNA ligase [Mycoplasma phocoenae]|uniref:Lysine--tRNA ligase n=1 Tax=Mycoplasma phocoenae TaxID=754517 RepID=A0A858U6C4_9MOLU|nr:lysine--tRNA ligase [Mycoplasma phocoenae]QJG66783.1 lysine--tRNA ligase [Mycoplasma phocoenae]